MNAIISGKQGVYGASSFIPVVSYVAINDTSMDIIVPDNRINAVKVTNKYFSEEIAIISFQKANLTNAYIGMGAFRTMLTSNVLCEARAYYTFSSNTVSITAILQGRNQQVSYIVSTVELGILQ